MRMRGSLGFCPSNPGFFDKSATGGGLCPNRAFMALNRREVLMSNHTKTLPHAASTLSHAIVLQGEFSAGVAHGYALLNYPPSLHLAVFESNRLTRFLPLTRRNLREAFGQERGDRCWQAILLNRRFSR
jgi:hypothetical protein